MNKWHQDSRFWMAFPWVTVLSFGLAVPEMIFLKSSNIWLAYLAFMGGGAAAQTTVRHYRARQDTSDERP